MNHFAKRWDYTLRIRALFEELSSLPDAAETIGAGKLIAQAIRKLSACVLDGDLGCDLEDAADEFDALFGIDNDYEARDRFNQALHSLYDVADTGKRVWIE